MQPQANALMQAMQIQDMQQRNALQGLQMQDVHAQRQAAMEQQKARQEGFREFVAGFPKPDPNDPRQVAMYSALVTGQLDPKEALAQMYPQRKVVRTVDFRGPDGKLYVQQKDEQGNSVGDPILKGLPLHYADNGQSIIPVDPGAAPGTTIQKLQTPESMASVGAQMANAAATRAVAKSNTDAARETAAATRDAASMQRDQQTEMKLGDDYRAQSKNFKDVMDAERRVTSALKSATTSAAATLAAGTSFMKLLDPGSVVRESELGMALAATGVFDRATNYFNTLQSGRVLTKSQAEDFGKITKQIVEAAKDGQRKVDTHFSDVAKNYKLRPENVVQDLGQQSTVLRFDANGNPVK
jgi:hypothetical protein